MASYDPVHHLYHLGPLIARISANPLVTHNDLIICADREMKNLSNVTREHVELNIMVGIQYILLHEYQSTHHIRVITGDDPVGSVYVGGSAKVLLSQLDDKHLRKILKDVDIRKVTDKSVVDRRMLISQIRAIRQKGYEVTCGERITGALCISVPVKNYYWPLALSVVGPESRLGTRLDETVKRALITADLISNSISEFFTEKEVKEKQIITEE
jgi:DNA-binding IclR family transcriptional regulator